MAVHGIVRGLMFVATCVVLVALVLAFSMLNSGPISVRTQSSFETLYTNLSFPVELAFAPDGRAFFTEKNTGNIRVIGTDEKIASQPFATVGPLPPMVANSEQGLIGIALDPNFATNHFLYAYWTYWDTANSKKHSRITKFTDVSNVGTNDGNIFDFADPNPVNPPNGDPVNHDGGYIKFGPDGKLYLELGDYCSWDCRRIALAQDVTTFAGKILRMNADGSVPSDNPSLKGHVSLIYAYGYRNGVGMDFSPTGKLIATMAGPDCCDRIFFVDSGANLGWPNCGLTLRQPPCSSGYTPSTYQWGSPTVTPTGIAFSSDPSVLVFGEWNTGNFMQLTLPPSGPAQIRVIQSFSGGIVSVERAPDGRIWFTSPDTIYRFTTTHVLMLMNYSVLGGGSPTVPVFHCILNRITKFLNYGCITRSRSHVEAPCWTEQAQW